VFARRGCVVGGELVRVDARVDLRYVALGSLSDRRTRDSGRDDCVELREERVGRFPRVEDIHEQRVRRSVQLHRYWPIEIRYVSTEFRTTGHVYEVVVRVPNGSGCSAREFVDIYVHDRTTDTPRRGVCDVPEVWCWDRDVLELRRRVRKVAPERFAEVEGDVDAEFSEVFAYFEVPHLPAPTGDTEHSIGYCDVHLFQRSLEHQGSMIYMHRSKE